MSGGTRPRRVSGDFESRAALERDIAKFSAKLEAMPEGTTKSLLKQMLFLEKKLLRLAISDARMRTAAARANLKKLTTKKTRTRRSETR